MAEMADLFGGSPICSTQFLVEQEPKEVLMLYPAAESSFLG